MSRTPGAAFQLQLDGGSGVPVSRQLIDQILTAIASGKLKAGDQVIVRGAELLRGNEPVQVVGIFDPEPQVAVK